MNFKPGILLTLIILLSYDSVMSQQTVADSLLAAYTSEKTDTAKVYILRSLIEEQIKTGQISKAKQTLRTMLLQADATDDNFYRAIANNLGSFVYASEANADSMLYFVDKALGFLKNEQGKEAIEAKIVANNNAAAAYSSSGNMKKTIEILINNLSLIQFVGNDRLYLLTLGNIAAGFTMTHDFQKAYEYAMQSANLADKPGTEPGNQASTYITAAVACDNLNKTKEQKHYLDKAKEALEKLGESPRWVHYYAHLALYYADTGQGEKALSTANKAFDLLKKYPERSNMYMAYMALRKAEYSMKHYKKARAAALKEYELAIEDNYTDHMITSAKDIADFSADAGDYKMAFEHMKRFNHLNDSLQSQENTQKINELEARLRTAQKEEKITQLQLDKRKTALQMKDQKFTNTLLGVGVIILLLTLLYLYTLYKNNKRNEAYRLNELRQQKELQVTQAVLEGEERERRRIARDLHDGLGGALSGIKMQLSGQQKQSDTQVLDKTILQLEQSIGELRRIARNLMPETLIRSGLEVALRDLCVSLSSGNTSIEFQPAGFQKSTPVQSQVNIYRIIQELLANAMRHGQASTIIVQCIQEGSHFFITVEDNGKGFDSREPSTGMGLSNIRNRINLMKGTIKVDSVINQGTTVNIELYV